MRIAFYAPLKPISDATASGDLMIARDLFRFFSSANLECIELSQFRAKGFWLSLEKIFSLILSSIRSLGLILKKSPDIFFTYHVYCKCPDVMAPVFSFLLRKPYIIYEASCSPKARKQWKSWPGYWLTRMALRQASLIISNMREDFEDLQQIVDTKKIVYIPPAVDIEFFKKNNRKAAEAIDAYQLKEGVVRILCVAMLREGCKADGIAFLLRSLELLVAKGINNFQLIIAGEGHAREELEFLAKEKLEDRVKFLGVIPRKDLVGLYSASDFFAFPGIEESFGMVFIEAEACGLPVVAIANAGVPEAVAHTRSGILTSFSEEEYAHALEEFIVSPEKRKIFQENARAYVEERHDSNKNYAQVVRHIYLLQAK